MPKHLMAYAKTPYLAVEEAAVELPREPLERIFLLLRTRTGHDFSSYKTTTIRRRIERRMGVHQINGPAAYVKYLQRNAHEIDILFKELLISVTSFFRDEQAWAALAKTALPNLIDSRPDNYNFRAWVPGCATGEEAFTIAILLRETAEQLGKHFDYQIFGTDLDAGAIEAARAGVYPDGIAVDVATGLLERYFHREDSTYRVRKEIREMCVFAPQNFIKDPPFTKLDLVCCRNLLIYLNADMQQRLLPIFHYALKPGGVLMLGPSETIGTHIDLFKAADKKWKIFTREETIANARVPNIPAQRVVTPDDPGPGATPAGPGAIKDSEVGKVVDRLLLARYAPASVVVNERGDIIYIHGRTGLYLEPAAGRPHMNAIEMAREGLEFELSACIRQAASGDDDVRREAVRMLTNGGQIYVDISVSRITDSKTLRGLLLITLKPAASPPVELPKKKARRGKAKHDPVAQLERELQYTKESLQTTVEELETSNEELKSTNEELQSTNEELQSSNEELETSKEEMQSLNEELNTVNAEMQGKLDELSRANDDLYNLLNSTEVATIFLDMQLRIKRFTDSARRLIKVIPSDVGRSIGDLKTNLKYDSLEDDARDVLRTLVWKEAELSTPDGQRFLMRIIPYRTVDNVIDGLVITFVDTQPLREAQNRLRESERELTLLSDLSPLLISYVDKDQRYVFTNKTYEKITGLASDQLRGMTVREVIGDEAYEVGLPHVEAVLRGNPRKFENELPRGDGGTYIAMMQFEPRRDESGEVIGFYVLATDVTDQKRVDAARAMAESIVATVREPLVVLDEGLRVVQCNRAFYDVFQLRDRQVVGELIYDASGAAWDNPKLRRLLEEILPHDTTVENFEITHTFPGAGRKQLLLNARRLHRALGLPAMILLAMEDVTRAGP